MTEQTDVEVAKVALMPYANTFYDGPNDPAVLAAVAYGEDLERRIAAAGGIEAWRVQESSSSTVA